MLPLLRQGSKGPAVEAWQHFLVGQGQKILVDGDFGPKTVRATKAFQREAHLLDDGVVGNQTYAYAMMGGFMGAEVLPEEDWPPPPRDLRPLTGDVARESRFGQFFYKPKYVTGEAIVVDQSWVRANIVTVKVPQLMALGLRFKVRCHRKAAEPLLAVFEAWEELNLLDRVITWNGCYVPRFVRGSRSVLSNHAWGTAFDINAAYNPIGSIPPDRLRDGSVRDLVEVANTHGWYWGGHYKGRKDGMHFELGRKVMR